MKIQTIKTMINFCPEIENTNTYTLHNHFDYIVSKLENKTIISIKTMAIELCDFEINNFCDNLYLHNGLYKINGNFIDRRKLYELIKKNVYKYESEIRYEEKGE